MQIGAFLDLWLNILCINGRINMNLLINRPGSGLQWAAKMKRHPSKIFDSFEHEIKQNNIKTDDPMYLIFFIQVF